MIPEFTVVRAVAVAITAVGLATLINGVRHAFLEEVVIGVLLLIGAWWLL